MADRRRRWIRGLVGALLGILIALSGDGVTYWPLDKAGLFAMTLALVGFAVGFTVREPVLENILRFLSWAS
jgi:hypothetical protein